MSTNTTPPEPDDVHLDAWITRQLTDLTNQVSEHLDLDAGLRDAQLVDRARLLDVSLDEALDLNSGLLAVIGRDAQPRQEPVVPGSTESTASAASLAQYARNLMSLPVNDRLMLRSHPSFRTLAVIHSLVVLPVHHQDVVDVLDHTHAVIRAVIRDLDHAPDLVRDLDHALTNALALVRNLNLTFGLDFDRVLVPGLDFDRVRALALARVRAFDRVRALAHDRALALARVRRHAIVLKESLEDALARDRDLKGVVCEALNSILVRVRGSGFDNGLDNALRTDVIRFSTHGEFAALASAIESVEAAAADFTTADLTHQDLLEVDLHGVRWSVLTTHWPPGWEEPMREASVQIDPDGRPDLYEVRDEPRVHHDAYKA